MSRGQGALGATARSRQVVRPHPPAPVRLSHWPHVAVVVEILLLFCPLRTAASASFLKMWFSFLFLLDLGPRQAEQFTCLKSRSSLAALSAGSVTSDTCGPGKHKCSARNSCSRFRCRSDGDSGGKGPRKVTCSQPRKETDVLSLKSDYAKTLEKDCLKQRLSALHSQGGQRCQPLLEDCLQHRGHGPLSPLLCSWFGAVLCILFYCPCDRVYFMSLKLAQVFIHWCDSPLVVYVSGCYFKVILRKASFLRLFDW